jgi:hypothetical protein
VSADGRKRLPALRVPQLKRKTEFYVFELLSLVFGASVSQVFFIHEIRWQTLAVCALGYTASFAMMVSVRCLHCREPLGRVNGKWGFFPDEACTKCGRDHG